MCIVLTDSAEYNLLIQDKNMRMTFKVTDIEWDVDDKADLERLPTSVKLTLDVDEEDYDEVDLFIGDYLSNIYGFCHFGFSYERIV